MARTGTHVIADLDANRTATVVEYGEDRVNEIVQAELAAHNALIADMMQNLAITTTERLLRSGAGNRFVFAETDELARDRTQKTVEGQTVGFPLRRFTAAVGWDYEALQVMTLGEIQRVLLRIQQGDRDNVQNAIKTALFKPTNETFFDEYGIPQADLPVKALYNADGSQIGDTVDGRTLNSGTHTHYLAGTALTVGLVNDAIRTVVEHGYDRGVEIFINETNTGAFAALTDHFVPALGPLITPGIGITTANVTADPGRITNTAVGVWDGRYMVRSKQWIPAGYFAVVAAGQDEGSRPLAFRQHQRPGMQGLQLVAENRLYPLEARYSRRFFGLGVYNRDSAAVANFTSATYVQPTF